MPAPSRAVPSMSQCAPSRTSSGVALSVGELALDGRAVMELLGVDGGPVVGAALRHLLGRVLEDPRLNNGPALASELRSWKEGRVREVDWTRPSRGTMKHHGGA